MTRWTAAVRVLLMAIIVIGCAGPEPSGSPEASLAAEASPSQVPSPAVESTSDVTPLAPTSEPTVEPEPTPEGASVRRTEVEINQDVVDRQGVPAALRDRYWWVGSDVGLLGTTAQLGLPHAETVEYAADGLVVSMRARFDERGTDIFVREFATGATVGEVRTSIVVYAALVADRKLFWAGIRPEKVGCGGWNVDGGVWVMNLDNDRGPVAIVEPGRVTNCGYGARGLGLSPSGETLVSGLGDDHLVDVIDVASLSRTHRLVGFWPATVTDDTFLQWDHEPTDGISEGLGGMTAYDLANGGERWTFPGKSAVEHFGPSAFLAVGSQFVVEYVWVDRPMGDIDVILSTFDPHTGVQRELLRQRETPEEDDIAEVQAALSSRSHLTLAFDRSSDWFGARPRVFSVLEVATGEVTWNAFTIDPPWLCYYGDCFRDG